MLINCFNDRNLVVRQTKNIHVLYLAIRIYFVFIDFVGIEQDAVGEILYNQIYRNTLIPKIYRAQLIITLPIEKTEDKTQIPCLEEKVMDRKKKSITSDNGWNYSNFIRKGETIKTLDNRSKKEQLPIQAEYKKLKKQQSFI